MKLRGYNHQSPLPHMDGEISWPDTFIDTPSAQFTLLADKQSGELDARIPLPGNTQQLWAQHKYSVMAHDPALYRELGPAVAHGRYASDFPGLALLLVHALRKPLQPGRVHNALAHMWGYLEQAGQPPADKHAMIAALQQGVSEQDLTYLMHSTALSGFAGV